MPASIGALCQIRYSFGLRAGHDDARSAEALMAQITGTDAQRPRMSLQERREKYRAYQAANKAANMAGDNTAERKASIKVLQAVVADDMRTDLIRQVTSADGFFERLATFWTDHFTVAARGRLLGLFHADYVDTAIRPHVGGRFADMVFAVITHPAMLIYLDQVTSVGPNSEVGFANKRGLNENLARELLELHTMGVNSGYTQKDVTQLAELLTGMRVTKDGFKFIERFAEPGAEQVLGQSYGGGDPDLADIRAFVEDVSLRPETARHISWKLAVHFVSDDPEETLIKSMTDAYLASRGDLKAVYGALLSHRAAWDPVLRKVKPPMDFVVSAFRALGVGADDLAGMKRQHMREAIGGPMESMGQRPRIPLGPDGFPEEASAWISPATLAARIKWAARLARSYSNEVDPRIFLQTALGGAASDNTRFAVSAAESKWEGTALVLASPEFNRR